MNVLRISAIIAVASALVLGGCRTKKQDVSAQNHPDCTNTKLWKKYDTPPGADPSIPDSLGGAGFEKIAEGMGYVSYVYSEEELKYLGDPRATTGGDIHFVSSIFPATFRPEGQNSSNVYNREVSSLVYETLISRSSHTGEYVPSLASHWKISDDKLTFRFRIDPNARFSDGKPVTAEDVVATHKLLMDETILEPSNQLVFGKFESPTVVSKYIVEVKCKTLNFRNILYFGGMFIQPAHEIGKLTGKEYLEKYVFNMPPGSGEYILMEKDIKEGKQYKLTRRDDYWAKDYPSAKYSGNFDKLIWEVVKDNPTIEYEKFKKGEVDIFRFTMATTEKWINDTTYDAIKNGWVRRARVFTDGPMGTGGYAFNMRKEPFSDIKVRQAFAHLLPRKQIVEKLLFNEYEPYDSQYPNTKFANPNNPVIDFNPEKAAQLLDEAGWKTRNADGVRTKNGRPFVIELAVQKTSERFITPYQQELRKAGIDMRLKYEDWISTLKNIDERNFTIFYFGYSGLEIPNPETSLKSSLADQKSNNNIQGVKNARIDEICDLYDKEFDVKKHVEMIREIDGITSAMSINAYQWNPRGIRIAFWDRFGMPEYILPRTGQLSYINLYPSALWWYDSEKAQAIQDAKATKKDLGGNKGIQEISYWKKLKQL